MEAVLTRPENDTVEAYWKMLSTLSRTVKLSLASKLTKSVLSTDKLQQAEDGMFVPYSDSQYVRY